MTEPLTPSRIAELRKLAEKAEAVSVVDRLTRTHANDWSRFKADLDPQTVIALLDEVERLRPETGYLKDTITMPYRRHRAMQITAHVTQAIGGFVERQRADPNFDAMRHISDALMQLFYASGAEVITDADREKAGLPPRLRDGLTKEELRIMEAKRAVAMLATLPSLATLSPEKQP